MSLKSICQPSVDTAHAGESVCHAAERMHQRSVGALVVGDDTNRPIGIVTDRDLTIRVIAAGRDLYGTIVRDVMTSSVKTIALSKTPNEALEKMRAGKFRRLPAVDESGQLAGIVTLDDILLQISMQWSLAAVVVRNETPQAVAASAR